MRAGVADQERISVGRRLGDARAAGHAGRRAHVLDHDRLPEKLAHALRLDARAHVDAAAGSEGNDERDRARGPFLRGGVTADGNHHRRSGDHHPAHARLLLAPDIRAHRRRDQGRRCRGRIIVRRRSKPCSPDPVRRRGRPVGASLRARSHWTNHLCGLADRLALVKMVLLSSRDADRERTRARGHDE